MKLSFAVVLLLSVGLLGSAQAKFPWCRCIDYKPVSSPWTLEAHATTQVNGNLVADFWIKTKAPVPKNQTACFKALAETGFHKLTINTNPLCDGKVSVMINGVPCTSQCELRTNGAGAYLKISSKDWPNASTANGTLITVVGSDDCNEWSKLFSEVSTYSYAFFSYSGAIDRKLAAGNNAPCCPLGHGSSIAPLPEESSGEASLPPDEESSRPSEESSTEESSPAEDSSVAPPEESSNVAPPPEDSSAEESSNVAPPPPEESSVVPPEESSTPTPVPVNPFPFCSCHRRFSGTPYSVKDLIEQALPNGDNQVTVTLAQRTDIDNSNEKCGDFKFNKIEFWIKDECQHAVSNISFAGNPRSPTFTNNGENKLTFKVTDLQKYVQDLPGQSVDGATIIFNLDHNSACPTLKTFLSAPIYSIFDKDIKCCPTNPLPLPQA